MAKKMTIKRAYAIGYAEGVIEHIASLLEGQAIGQSQPIASSTLLFAADFAREYMAKQAAIAFGEKEHGETVR